MMHFDEDGLIDDYAVMIRPLSALEAMRDAVFARLPPDAGSARNVIPAAASHELLTERSRGPNTQR
jgi:hypothetical protein